MNSTSRMCASLCGILVAMLSEEHRYLYPLDKQLMEMADGAFSLLESVYDEAPLPEDWRLTLALI